LLGCVANVISWESCHSKSSLVGMLLFYTHNFGKKMIFIFSFINVYHLTITWVTLDISTFGRKSLAIPPSHWKWSQPIFFALNRSIIWFIYAIISWCNLAKLSDYWNINFTGIKILDYVYNLNDKTAYKQCIINITWIFLSSLFLPLPFHTIPPHLHSHSFFTMK
jgi:hypothetical protein